MPKQDDTIELTQQELEAIIRKVLEGSAAFTADPAIQQSLAGGGGLPGLRSFAERDPFTAKAPIVTGPGQSGRLIFPGGSPFPVQTDVQETEAVLDIISNAIESNRRLGNPVGDAVGRIAGAAKQVLS